MTSSISRFQRNALAGAVLLAASGATQAAEPALISYGANAAVIAPAFVSNFDNSSVFTADEVRFATQRADGSGQDFILQNGTPEALAAPNQVLGFTTGAYRELPEITLVKGDFFGDITRSDQGTYSVTSGNAYLVSGTDSYTETYHITDVQALSLWDGDVQFSNVGSIETSGGQVLVNQKAWGMTSANGIVSVDHSGSGIQLDDAAVVSYQVNSISTRDQYLFSGNVVVPASATLEAVFNDSHAANQAFFKAKQFDIADGATIKVNGSSADYTKPNEETTYLIVEADTLNANLAALNLTSEDLTDVRFADAGDNQISVVVTAQDLAALAGSLGDGPNSVAAAAGLQSVLAQQGGTAMGDELYDLAVSLRDGGSFEQLAPMVENTSGASIRGADAQAAGRVGSVLQSYRGGAAGGSSGDAPLASGLWIQGLSSSGEQDAMGSANGFDVDTTGYAIGYDAEFVKGLTTGFAISYADSDVDVDNSLDGQNSDGYTGALYAQYQFDNNYYGSGILSYGQNDNDSQRWVANSYANASFDSDILSVRLEGGKEIWFDALLVQPMVAFNYSDIGVDGYTETGSVAALNVGGQDYSVVELGFGAVVSQEFAVGQTVLRPELRAAYYHDFKQDGVQITSSFTAGGNNFVTTGEDADANRYNLNAGVAWVLGDNNTLRASYDFNSSDHYTGGTWLVDYRMDF